MLHNYEFSHWKYPALFFKSVNCSKHGMRILLPNLSELTLLLAPEKYCLHYVYSIV
jgi:hypothetical protein